MVGSTGLAAVLLVTLVAVTVSLSSLFSKSRVNEALTSSLEVDGEFDRILLQGADVAGDMSISIWRNASAFRRFSYHKRPKMSNLKRGIVALDSDPSALSHARKTTLPYVSSLSAFDRDAPVYELGDLSVVEPSFFAAHPPSSVDKVVYAYVDVLATGVQASGGGGSVCVAWSVIDKQRAWSAATAGPGHEEEREDEPERCPVSGLAYPALRRPRNIFAVIEATLPLTQSAAAGAILGLVSRRPTIQAVGAAVEGASCEEEMSVPVRLEDGSNSTRTVRVTGGWRQKKTIFSLMGTVFVFEPFINPKEV